MSQITGVTQFGMETLDGPPSLALQDAPGDRHERPGELLARRDRQGDALLQQNLRILASVAKLCTHSGE